MLNERKSSFRSWAPCSYSFIAALVLIWVLYVNFLPFPLKYLYVFRPNTTSFNTGVELDPEGDRLRILCGNTTWRPGMWLQCHSYAGENKTGIHGGLNNARNRLQTCVRLAIDSGSGLIIAPVATIRNSENPSEFSHTLECPDTYWDINNMALELQQHCPQLELRFCGNISGIDTIVPTEPRHYSGNVYHNGTFREMIDSTLKNASIQTLDPAHPVAVSFGDSYIAWNYTASNELLLRKSLFKILPFNSELLDFSDQILQSPQLSQGFVGVHLRGEQDWPGEFGNRDEQMDAYIAEIEHVNETRDIKIVYVSCGWQDAIGWFRAKLEQRGYTVHDKWTLSADFPEMMARLEALSFDQKAIVEYQVLVGADYWYGVLLSTMSALVAYARTVDHPEAFFPTYIQPGSTRTGQARTWDIVPALKGDNFTKLLVVNAGPRGLDIMDSFP
jgi:hypothetical protein